MTLPPAGQARNPALAEVRAWAAANGHDVSRRGRIPAAVIAAFIASGGTWPAKTARVAGERRAPAIPTAAKLASAERRERPAGSDLAAPAVKPRRKVRSSQSVWTVGQAGSPGLGKRR